MPFCNSWARRAPRFSRNHWKPEISKKSNIFTDKRKARFSLKSKLFETEEFLPQARLFFRPRPKEKKKYIVLWRKDKKKEDRTTIQETLYILFFVWN